MKPARKVLKVKKARTELLFLKRLPKNRKKALRVKKEIRVKKVKREKPVQLEQQGRKATTEKLR